MIKKRQARNGPRYDVRWRAPDGTMRNKTFRTKAEALDYEGEQRTARYRGTWIDPRHARVDIFEPYAEKWLTERPDLRPRTVELYESLLRCHIVPKFGSLPLGKITTSAVRSWNAELKGRHPVTAAKAYRLLKLIMGTAVADDRIGRNPCTVKGAGQERSPERLMLSIAEVDALVSAMPGPWRSQSS